MGYIRNQNFRSEFLDWCRRHLTKFNEGSGLCSCPALDHEDKNPSCRVDYDEGHFNCFSCSLRGHSDEIARMCKLPAPPPKSIWQDPPKTNRRRNSKGANPNADRAYDKRSERKLPFDRDLVYRNADGTPNFKERKYKDGGDKTQRLHAYSATRGEYQRTMELPDGTKCERTLYNLDFLSQLSNGKPQQIWWTEGPTDAETASALGAISTTTCGGAQNAHLTKDLSVLASHDIVFLPDNDQAGQDYVMSLLPRLWEIANSVKIVNLPVGKHGDLTDFVESGGTKEDVLKLIAETAPLTQSEVDAMVGKPNPENTSRFKVEISKDPQTMRVRVGEVLLKAIESGRIKFLRKNGVLLTFDENGDLYAPNIKAARFEWSELIDFGKWKKGRNGEEYWVSEGPPDDFLGGANACPHLFEGILPFRRFVHVPVVNSDGTIIRSGYDAESQIFSTGRYEFLGKMPLEEAVAILKLPFSDFPFVAESDRTNLFAIVFTFLCREVFEGKAPIAIFSAPKEGSGKSLAADTTMELCTGRLPTIIHYTTDAESFNKELVSVALLSPEAINIDNVADLFDSPKLASMGTAEKTSSRLLGGNTMVEIENTSQWFITGNNITVTGETGRRSFLIRINANCEDPEERTGFSIPDLKRWRKQRENKQRFLAAGISIVLHWLDAGAPRFKTKRLGSFVDWCEVVGGVLEFAGFKSFLGNKDEFKKHDPERETWRNFVREWWKFCEGGKVSAGDLLDVITMENPGRDHRDFSNHRKEPLLALGRDGIQSQCVRLGIELGKKKGQVFELNPVLSVKIVRSDDVKATYFLEPLEANVTAVPDVVPGQSETDVDEGLDAFERGEVPLF